MSPHDAAGPGRVTDEQLRRAFDLLVAGVAAAVFGPLMLLIAIAVRLESRGPVLFRQTRIGAGGVRFSMYKFRKFSADAGPAGSPLTVAADPRLTLVGRVLVATKLDELPQLWNVLRGHMSIVGPRPESLAFADCFQGGAEELLRYKPGLLGPCQIMFRNETTAFPSGVDVVQFYRTVLFPTKARIDLEYFSRRTLATDVGIVLRGVLAVCGWTPETGAVLKALRAEASDGAAGPDATPAAT